MSGCGGKQRQKNKRKEGGKEGKQRRRWRCEKDAMEAEEERENPSACEMKRINGLHTSRRGEERCVGEEE